MGFSSASEEKHLYYSSWELMWEVHKKYFQKRNVYRLRSTLTVQLINPAHRVFFMTNAAWGKLWCSLPRSICRRRCPECNLKTAADLSPFSGLHECKRVSHQSWQWDYCFGRDGGSTAACDSCPNQLPVRTEFMCPLDLTSQSGVGFWGFGGVHCKECS